MKRCVLTTRSADQAGELLVRLRKEQLQARNLPLLRFRPNRFTAGNRCPDWLIALTPAALKHGWFQLPKQWQQQASLAAVGPGTLARLQQLSQRPVLAPSNSGGANALLASLPESLLGQRIALLGTEVLSPTLAQALQQRGAKVEGLVAARSEVIPPSAARVGALLQRYDQVLSCLMSQRAMDALEALDSSCLNTLKRQTVFVMSARLGQHAQTLDWQRIVVAPEATLDSLCQSIIAWHKTHE
jgi:uroporphyrinogen-III synthase